MDNKQVSSESLEFNMNVLNFDRIEPYVDPERN